MQPAANTKRGGDRYVENQPQDRLMKLEGVVEHMIYENTETGYAVFEVDAGGTDVIVAGNVGSVDNGMSVTVYGRMVNHPSYGEQFKAETCEASLPQDTTALLSYLSSGVLPYIGPSTAKKIVSMFGEDTLNVISETPQSLCRIKGITPERPPPSPTSSAACTVCGRWWPGSPNTVFLPSRRSRRTAPLAPTRWRR